MKREEELRDRSYIPAALFIAFVIGAAGSTYLYFGPANAGTGTLSGARVDVPPVETQSIAAPRLAVVSTPASKPVQQVFVARAPIAMAANNDRLGLDGLAAKNPNLFGTRAIDRELEGALAGVVRIEKHDLSAIAARTTPAPRTEPVVAASPFISRLSHNARRPEVGELDKSDAASSKLRYGRSISAEIDMAAVRETIERKLPEARACYERAAELDAGLYGVVRIEMTIGKNGDVEALAFAESTIDNEELSRCLALRINTWTFPQPKGARAVVNYPLVFVRS